MVAAYVTRREQVEAPLRRPARFGRIDVWVNNAGQGICARPRSSSSTRDMDAMMRAMWTRALRHAGVLPHFRERGVAAPVMERCPRCWPHAWRRSARPTAGPSTSSIADHRDAGRGAGHAPGHPVQPGVAWRVYTTSASARATAGRTRAAPRGKARAPRAAAADPRGVIDSRRPDADTRPARAARARLLHQDRGGSDDDDAIFAGRLAVALPRSRCRRPHGPCRRRQRRAEAPDVAARHCAPRPASA